MDIGKVFNITKLHEDFNLPNWEDIGIVRSEIENLPSQQRIKQYLRNKKYPVDSLNKALMAIKKTRQPKPSREYYRITIPILMEVIFHEKEGYKPPVEEKVEKRTIIRPVRNGAEWFRVKVKSAPLFQPSEKYKTVDEFASFASREELEELWSR